MLWFVVLSACNVRTILPLANEYLVDQVNLLSENFLLTQELTFSNLELAEKFGMHRLEEKCLCTLIQQIHSGRYKTMAELSATLKEVDISGDLRARVYRAMAERMEKQLKATHTLLIQIVPLISSLGHVHGRGNDICTYKMPSAAPARGGYDFTGIATVQSVATNHGYHILGSDRQCPICSMHNLEKTFT